MVAVRDLHQVGLAMSLATQDTEVEPDHAWRMTAGANAAALRQGHIHILRACVAGDVHKQLCKLPGRPGLIAHPVNRLGLKLEQAVVGSGVEVEHRHALLDQTDGG